jgi:hypothetical protein
MTTVTLGVLLDRLPPGTAVYMDRDWIDHSETVDVSSAIFLQGEELQWPSGAVRSVNASDPDRAVWTMIDALARTVADLAVQQDVAPRVLGDGLLASRIRTRIATTDDTGVPPALVVETTGSPAGTSQACSIAADLGTVLLAATPLDGTMPYDLYQDVHRRGLSLIGVPDPNGDGSEEHVSTDAFSPPGQITPGESGPFTSEWFVARS